MHHRPSGLASGLPTWALRRCAAALGRRTGSLLALAVGLLLAAGSLIALPHVFPAAAGTTTGGSTTDGSTTDVALDAAHHPAAHRQNHGDHRRQTPAPAAAPNPNCTLLVPPAPTSSRGLAAPYQLVATDRAEGSCHEANDDQSAFVEAAVYNPARHEVAIYHPLVVDAGDRPAVPPVVPSLPPGAVVGVWFGFNGDTLTLGGPGARSCVNGLPGSPFGQFAYCNAPAFFAAATHDQALQATIPDLGTATDGRPCPTTRDFTVVDQDQSDNLATAYRVVGGRIAQLTRGTVDATPLTNGSDEGLLAKFIDPALRCQPWKAQDLTDPGQLTAALALNELSAAKNQAAPALVPLSDPMVQVDGAPSVPKANLYRAGVDQPPLPAGQTPKEYCAGVLTAATGRLAGDAAALRRSPSPTPGTTLLTFLRDRLTTSLQELGCAPLPAPRTTPRTPTTPVPPAAAPAPASTGRAAPTAGGKAPGTTGTRTTGTSGTSTSGTTGTTTTGTGTATTGTGTTGTGTGPTGTGTAGTTPAGQTDQPPATSTG